MVVNINPENAIKVNPFEVEGLWMYGDAISNEWANEPVYNRDEAIEEGKKHFTTSFVVGQLKMKNNAYKITNLNTIEVN